MRLRLRTLMIVVALLAIACVPARIAWRQHFYFTGTAHGTWTNPDGSTMKGTTIWVRDGVAQWALQD